MFSVFTNELLRNDLTQKVILLDEKLVEANSSLEQARAKIGDLIAENKDLRAQISQTGEQGNRLHQKQEEALKLLHNSGTLSVEQIAQSIGLSAPDTKFHLDKLNESEYVHFDLNASMNVARAIRSSGLVASRGGRIPQSQRPLGHYYILSKGREYVVTKLTQ